MFITSPFHRNRLDLVRGVVLVGDVILIDSRAILGCTHENKTRCCSEPGVQMSW